MSDSSTAAEGTEAPQGAEGAVEGQEAAPSLESLQAQLDEWKGHARKHEERAKANAKAAEELETLKRERMSDEERAKADATALQTRLAEAESAAEKAALDALRFRLAAKHGLSDEDAELFLTASDEETMSKQAAGIAARSVKGNLPNPAQGRRSSDAATGSIDEQGAAALAAAFNS